MSDVEGLRDELKSMKQEVSGRFGRVEKALEALTSVIKDLVRLDGDTRVLREAVGRIGSEVDDHEDRLRKLEGRPAKRYELMVDRALMLVVGAVAALLTSKLVGF